MKRENQQTINILNMLSDGMLIYLSYFVALYLRFIVLGAGTVLYLWEFPYTFFAAVLSGCIVAAFNAMKMYGSYRFKRWFAETFNILLINGVGIVFLTALLFMLKISDFSRGVLLLFWAVSSVMVIAKRIIIRAILRKNKAQGYGRKSVLVIGTGNLAANYIKNATYDVILEGYLGQKKVGFPIEYLGEYSDLEKVLSNRNVDELIVALDATETEYTRDIVVCAEARGIKLSLIPFYSEYFSGGDVTVSKVGGNNVIEYEHKLTHKHPVVQKKKIYWLGKRLFDIVASLGALIVLAIPMGIVALLIYIDDPKGSPIFSQPRIGRKGKFFRMYKFRSMVVNAEDLLKELQDKNEADGPAFKMKDDPRITKIGKFIRKTSIDELPQLFNVLKGDMSIVGPRPALAEEVEKYDEHQKQRLSVTPGLTCYWQVTPNRNDLTFEEWMDLDIKYIYERSWGLDLKLMFKTLGVMLDKEGR